MNFIDHQQTNGPQQCFAVRGKSTTHGVELLWRRDDDVGLLHFLHVMGPFFFNGIAGQFADTKPCGEEAKKNQMGGGGKGRKGERENG